MRVNKIACYLAAATLLLAVPAISDAGKSVKSAKSGKSSKSLKCTTAGTFLNAANTTALGPFSNATSSVGKCNSGFGIVPPAVDLRERRLVL